MHQVCSSSSGLPWLAYPPLLLLLEDTITAGLCAWSGGIPPIHKDTGSWCCTFRSPQERMALERRIPTKLSALKDRLIAAFDKSLYLSSHSREIAWTPRSDKNQKYTLEKFEHCKEAFTSVIPAQQALCSSNTSSFFYL